MKLTNPIWRLREGRELILSTPLVVGAVNYTNTSFVEETRNYSLEETIQRVTEHLRDGADIIDIGAESTKPSALPICPLEEEEKLCSVLRSLQESNINTIFSIDTYKASVARAVLEYSCDIINDITGFEYDKGLVDVLCEYKPGYVLTFTTRYSGNRTPTIDDMMRYFEQKLSFLVQKGLPEEHIVLDIGVGFGYTYPYTVEIIRNIRNLYCFNRPLYLGISHKTWYQESTQLSYREKESATGITTALLASIAHIHRVHNVALAKRALYIASHLA